MKKTKGWAPPTIRACFQRYQSEHGPHVIDQGRIRWAWKHLKGIGHHLVGESTYPVTARYALKRQAAGAAVGTVNRELGVLQAALRYAFKHGMIKYVPPLYRCKRGPARKLVLNKEQIGQLLNKALSAPYEPWLFRFVMLLAYTGQRKEAILSLEWDQVDFGRGLIDFNKAIPMAERRKGRGIVPINDELMTYLKVWKEMKGCPYVVQHNYGWKVGRIYQPYRAWYRLVEACGFDHTVTPHVLRHSLATMLVRKHENIRHVQQLLGHKSVVTTEREYVKNDPETIRGTVAGLRF